MKRPRIQLKPSKLQKVLEWLAVLFVLLSFLLIIFAFNHLPETIPIYFNWPSKDENGMAGKELLGVVPLITGALVGLLLFLSRFPRLMNYPVRITKENAERHYHLSVALLKTVALAIAAMGFLFTLSAVFEGLGKNILIGSYLQPAGAFVMLSIVMVYLLKLIRLD